MGRKWTARPARAAPAHLTDPRRLLTMRQTRRLLARGLDVPDTIRAFRARPRSATAGGRRRLGLVFSTQVARRGWHPYPVAAPNGNPDDVPENPEGKDAPAFPAPHFRSDLPMAPARDDAPPAPDPPPTPRCARSSC